MTILSEFDQNRLIEYRKLGLKNDATLSDYKMSPIVHKYIRRFFRTLQIRFWLEVFTGKDYEGITTNDKKLDEIWRRMTELEMMEASVTMFYWKAKIFQKC